MTLIENDLQFEFNDIENEEKFDRDEIREKSNLKTVDFLVEYNDCYRFIEVKDLDCPNPQNPDEFMKKFKSGSLIESLAMKYRDSKFYLLHTKRPIKKYQYLVLIASKNIDSAMLLNKQEQLKAKIPIEHKNWDKASLDVCAILNIDKWKKCYGENSIKRISDNN